MKILGIIPARKNSKRIQNKNFKELAGKPLVDWTIEAAVNSNVFNEIIISTDSESDHERLLNYPVLNIGLRPPSLSQDSTPTIEVIKYAVEQSEITSNYRFDLIVTLQPTSPLRTSVDIKNSVIQYISDEKADSLVSVTEIPHIFHPEKIFQGLPLYINFEEKMMSYQQKQLYITNGAAIYITSRDILHKTLLGKNCTPFLMPRWRSIDVDTLEDFKMADLVLRNKSLFENIH